MEREFQDKKQWAVILGGSSGLGLATARKLALHGMNICVVHRTLRAEMKQVLEDFRSLENQGVSVLSFNKDACREKHVEQVLERLVDELGGEGRVRVLVHSIARGNLKPIIGEMGEKLTRSDLVQTLDAMALSLYDWSSRLQARNLFCDRASIISFTSEGNSRVIDGYGAVSAAKSALESISRQMAVEFAPFGIRVNCIQAGVTDTRSLRMIPGNERLRKIAIQRNPNRRLTRAEDVANAVFLLCREEANWINGTTLIVDGGEHLR
jgi:enoyl-[acyl-carrier protein] reductase I